MRRKVFFFFFGLYRKLNYKQKEKDERKETERNKKKSIEEIIRVIDFVIMKTFTVCKYLYKI